MKRSVHSRASWSVYCSGGHFMKSLDFHTPYGCSKGAADQ